MLSDANTTEYPKLNALLEAWKITPKLLHDYYRHYDYPVGSLEVGFKIENRSYDGVVKLTFGVRKVGTKNGVIGTHTLVEFNLDNYPACCAMIHMHHFKYNCTPFFKEEQVQELLKAAIDEFYADRGAMWFSSRRLICEMVEYESPLHRSAETGSDNTNPDAMIFEGVDPATAHSGEIMYRAFYDFFKKQRKVNTRLMFNKNTNRIIHDLEVLF